MASPESKQIRATFVKNPEAIGTPVEIQRQEWEAAVEVVNQTLRATIEPVDLDGIPGEWVRYEATTGEGVILHLHGGGFNAGSCKTHRAMAAHLAQASSVPVLTVDYRLAPEYPCPAAIEDGVKAYRWLLHNSFSGQQIVLGGDSAGGGLVLAALVKIRDEDLPLPAGAFLISPWVDLAMAGESMLTHAHLDPLTSYEDLYWAAQLYLGQADPKDPLASPLYADLQGLSPLLIHVGEHEVLVSDSLRLAEKAQAAGVEFQLEVWEEMWHVWHGWGPDLPEAIEAIGRIGEFVRQKIQ
jgi:epsilon-lactone hydrolase